ncbi:MAG: copper-translocating P-type ATPase [Sulfurimonas sp.]|uniref:copper-transporting P-type ATPase n=1 Tax=Sulfurimonas sp. TaxID=2022749 RepID=UPI002633F6A7|nr:copper-translocating P-type ATPase [Sulfurimonas sp.]MCW8894906.1 copper-translocating P-type ATPase [Sulfurimonas sp.]MCW8954813.1 copper-translocating P-type ATPase [Sulfurimonas sp.]MCW9068186.1 copper-translocating P-type ATPase [Sulfurimonas sp.]
MSIEDKKYTCPMHPEIIENHPASCPKCGMALEPMVAVANDEENDELNYMSKRFWISIVLALPVFVVAMISDLVPEYLPQSVTMKNVQWFLFILASPVVVWGGWPFFVRGYNSIKTWNLNMFTLIAIGVGAAYMYSLVALFLPEVFPPLMQTKEGLVHVYFEAAAVIITLVLLGQVLELRARSKTNSAIKTLLNLAPKQAHRIDNDGNEENISLELIHVGDKLRIKPGEKIPVDGVVVEGQSNIDESMITGEPMLISKTKDDSLIGATLNKNGTLVMVAQRVGSDTMLSQIVHMVAQAQRSRAPIQKLADTVASYFVPAVVISAILAFLGWFIFGPEPRLAYAIVAAVAVLIIACPCALGLATPISIMVGTGRAALSGILIKDAKTLETMEKINTLVVDKTGTLTEGKPKVTTLNVEDGFDEKDVLKYAASLEQVSEHPLAEAVVEHAKESDLDFLHVDNFEAIIGKGITGEIENKKIVLGSESFLDSLNISTKDTSQKADALRKEGKGVIFMAIDSKFSAIIGIEDPIKLTSIEAIKELKAEGIKVVMLSGDNKTTANAVARKLDIDEVYANIMPDAKAKVIKQLQDGGAIVAMAGDGINDAPALAQADIGIAMGTGTDVAIESAGVTLIKGDLLGIVKVLKLSHATMKNIKQNLFFAFVYNSVGIPIAAGVFYPFFGILLSPVIAAAAMSFSSVSVIVNALRLKNVKI